MRALRTLRVPGFGRLATASLVNELGNWLGEIALAIVVFDQTGSPVAVAGLFIAMQFVPAVATPPVVARLDSLHSRGALPLLYFAEAAAFCVLAVLAGDDAFVLAGVLAVAAFDGTMATAARARTRAAAASLLEPQDLLREGNGVLNIGVTAGAAVGPALAGLLVATAGAQVALLADAASFLAVGLFLATSRSLPAAHGEEVGGWLARMRRGFTYVRERVALQRLMVAEGAAFVFFALVLPIEVAFAKDTLDVGDFGYGLLLAAWGVGMVIGSVLFTWLRVSLTTLLAGGTLGIGIAYVATGVSPNLAFACAASVIGGIGNGVQWVAVITAVQNLTTGAYQARVVGLLESLASGLSGVGFLLGGAIAALMSPRASFVVAGTGVLLILGLAILALRGVRWERETEVAAEARPEIGVITAG
jgi:MFS family permease